MRARVWLGVRKAQQSSSKRVMIDIYDFVYCDFPKYHVFCQEMHLKMLSAK